MRGLRQRSTVDITVSYPTTDAAGPLPLRLWTGGRVVAPAKNLTVAADGAIHSKFRAGHQPGVLFKSRCAMEFRNWVFSFGALDEEHPANNPRV